MVENTDDCPAKRLKIIDERNHCSTFEDFSFELILEIFEYFHAKEIFESFFNYNAFINSCICNRHHKVHLYADITILWFCEIFSCDQIISVHIEHLFIEVDQFPKLKSLYIVQREQKDDRYLNMITQIFKLSELINFTLILVNPTLELTAHNMIKKLTSHPSLQRIILSTTTKVDWYIRYSKLPKKMVFSSKKIVNIHKNFDNDNLRYLRCNLNKETHLSLDNEYHIRFLNLTFDNWPILTLSNLLSSLPLLILSKINGHAESLCWLMVNLWEDMLQNLKELKHVDIDIYIDLPLKANQLMIDLFNDVVTETDERCQRINLTLGKRTKTPGIDCYQISASL